MAESKPSDSESVLIKDRCLFYFLHSHRLQRVTREIVSVKIRAQ